MGALAGRRERRMWTAEPPVPPYLGANLGGGSSSHGAMRAETALGVPAAWACVQLLAGAVSMMPLRTFRRTADGGQVQITDPAIVTSPEEGMTQSEWKHMLMVSLLLRGNAYGLGASINLQQRWDQIVLLNPDKVRVEVDRDTGAVRYYTGPTMQTDVTDRMWHVRGLTLPGSKVALSVIEYAAMAIGVDLSSRKFARDFFDGGGIPKATLTTDLELTQEQASTAKQRLMAATRNREPAVFGMGVKYTPISVKPEESQFLATQRASISDVARFFGVPPEMVGGDSGNSMTYSNVEQRSLDFLTYGVAFWLRRIEDAFSTLLPAQQHVEFDTSALLRTDAETQAKVRVQYIAGKVLPPSRVLAEMNEPPLTQDEKRELEMVPLTVTATGMPRAVLKGGGSNVDVGEVVTPDPNASGQGQSPAPAKPKLGVVANG